MRLPEKISKFETCKFFFSSDDSAGHSTDRAEVHQTAQLLQQRVNELEAQLEQREQNHQDMYLMMFRKGQESAQAEMEVGLFWILSLEPKHAMLVNIVVIQCD